ncbi:MAG: hypothetical protein FJY88_11035 [Candidatus Eisenbacteria bacterium]|nr:hypothetical protein [Candidatus Eisenbacteria bacterium]
MSGGSKAKAAAAARGISIHSTRLQLVLYSFLLVLTPFILLQNFLVDMVGQVSGSTLSIGGLRVPIVPLAAFVLLLAAAIRFRRAIKRRWLLAMGIVALLDALAQQVTDIYFGHNFYDLQQNWHYIAYGLFAFMVHRDLSPRGMPLARILWLTFALATAFSCFDEYFQLRMSSRVFDLSDTGKDILGSIMGMVIICVGGRRWQELLQGWRRIGSAGFRGAFSNPVIILAIMTAFDLIFLSVASLLSDFEYAGAAVGITLSLTGLLLCALALLFRPWGRILLAAAAAVLLVYLGYSHIRPRNTHVSENRYGWTVYRGIPIPFFDLLVYPNGAFRLVDKKHYFNSRDQRFLLAQKSDIILIGTGDRGLGGKGFPEVASVQFLYNPHLARPTQVILLRTPEACQLFNRLKKEGKSVLFVLHNTC